MHSLPPLFPLLGLPYPSFLLSQFDIGFPPIAEKLLDPRNMSSPLRSVALLLLVAGAFAVPPVPLSTNHSTVYIMSQLLQARLPTRGGEAIFRPAALLHMDHPNGL